MTSKTAQMQTPAYKEEIQQWNHLEMVNRKKATGT